MKPPFRRVKSIPINNSLYLRIPIEFVRIYNLKPGEEYIIEFQPGQGKKSRGRLINFKLVVKK